MDFDKNINSWRRGYYGNTRGLYCAHQLRLCSHGLGFQSGGGVSPGSGSILQRETEPSFYSAGATQLDESSPSEEQLGPVLSGSRGGYNLVKKKYISSLTDNMAREAAQASSLGHTHVHTHTSTT